MIRDSVGYKAVQEWKQFSDENWMKRELWEPEEKSSHDFIPPIQLNHHYAPEGECVWIVPP